MHRKRFFAAILSLSLLVVQGSVMAETIKIDEIDQTQIAMEKKEEKSLYMTQKGKITELSAMDQGTRILVGDYSDGIIFNLQPKVQIIDSNNLNFISQSDLKEGMDVTVVFPKNSPMAMSMPPLSSSAVLVFVNSPERSLEVAYFDENLVNEANTLKLNIGENTVIMNTKGERRVFTAEDIKNKNAAVIYDVTTKSIPAQTTPLFVMILEDEKTSEIETKDVEETSYRPLRELAAQLEGKLTWDNENKLAILTKGDIEIAFKAGEASCSINNEVQSLQKLNKLEANMMFVSDEITNLMK